jgi:predicted transcriptional regulator
MTNLELRKLALNQYSDIKKAMPTITQRAMITFIRQGVLTTSMTISDEFDISLYNASRQLKELHKKKYVTRIARQGKTGGIFYEYTFNKELI